MIYAAEDDEEAEKADDGEMYGKKTMREWVFQTTVCRRVTLSSFLDSGRITCTLLRGAALCDVCLANSNAPHPRRLVEFSGMKITSEPLGRMAISSVPPISLDYELSRASLDEDAG